MASLVEEQEVTMIYGSDQELNSGLSTEKVQAMANSIYSEFKRMMGMYGEDVIKELMPLIVTILEAHDRALTECNESNVEIEMLRDDNEHLVSQYDRERQLRRTAEQHLMENEDQSETATREWRAKAEGLETTTRHLELKCKNYTDQVERLQEREAELRREYSILHDRHTEMIQSYMEHIERTKILQQQQSYTELSQSPRNKKDLPLVGTTPSPMDSPSVKGFTTDSNYNTVPNPASDTEVDTPETVSNRDSSHFSLKDEIPKSLPVTPTTTPASDVNSPASNHQQAADMDIGSPSVECGGQGWVSAEMKEMLKNGELNLEQPSPESGLGHIDDGLESTGIENEAFEKTHLANESSLYAELSEQDIGDVDEGADLLGMSKEVENLINENAKLLATKNALNVVKDDLIQQVDQLTTQHALLKEELKQAQKARSDQEEKLQEFEKQINKLQKDLNIVGGGNSGNSTKTVEDEEVLPMSQRKRFTRVEMARVLMERNQYKERLMELQEAVRWTETLRASRAHPDLNQNKGKNKSTIFQFFSRLFTSNSSDNVAVPAPESHSRPVRRSHGSDVGINMLYNVPSSKIMPRSRSTQISLYGRSPTIDALREEPNTKTDTLKREVQTKMIDSRFQACGWSLPNSPATPKDGPRTVPVPVYCGPVFHSEPNMKLWCAAAINVSVGHTKDGGYVVGSASIFYNKPEEDESADNEKASVKQKNALKALDQEIASESKKMKKEAKQRSALSSYVWLVAGDSRSSKVSGGNMVYVMDACEPSCCVEQFSVGSSETNILCIASIPGAEVEDYSLLEESDTGQLYNKSDGAQGDVITEELTTSTSQSTILPTSSSSDEVGIEATEELRVKGTSKKLRNRGIITEHVFNEPGDIHPTLSTSSDTSLHENAKVGKIEKVISPSLSSSDPVMNEEDGSGDVKSDTPLDYTRLASVQPTMWLGAQNGFIYVHSGITNWRKCLHQIRLKDSVLAIVHLKGRVMAALADGTVAFFRRHADGFWNLSNYHLLDLGRPHHSIRCMSVVYDRVWCAYRNKIHIVEPLSMKIQSSFDAHPRTESQVRQLAWAGDGVWISIRLDSTVRLYHARTLQHLQDVDVEPYVSKVLGSGKLGFSFVRITALMISNHRLWIGTGNGVVMSVPLSEGAKTSSSTPVLSSTVRDRPGGVVRVYSDPVSDRITPGTFIPYCSMANAQLSFHGYRDAVKFFVSVPGCVTLSSSMGSARMSPPTSLSSLRSDGTLVLSGGGGYVDFRKGDLGALSPEEKKIESAKLSQGTLQTSHVIVWQLTHS